MPVYSPRITISLPIVKSDGVILLAIFFGVNFVRIVPMVHFCLFVLASFGINFVRIVPMVHLVGFVKILGLYLLGDDHIVSWIELIL